MIKADKNQRRQAPKPKRQPPPPKRPTTSLRVSEAPSSLDTFIKRASETTGWQRQHHERAAMVVVPTDGSFLCSVVQFVQPGLASFLPWLADTMGAGWARYAIKALEFIYTTNTPTTSAGNIVLGWLPNASDPLPTNMLEATQNAIYSSGNINANTHLRVKKCDLEESFDELKFTRDGLVEGDINNYDAGVFYVATEGFNTLETGTLPDMLEAGFIDVKMDVAFVDKKVATDPVLSDQFNTEISLLYSMPSSSVTTLPWFDGNNNPVGLMIDADGSPQFQDIYLPFGTFEIVVRADAINTVAPAIQWCVEVAYDPSFDTLGSFTRVKGSTIVALAGGIVPPHILTSVNSVIVTNPSRAIQVDDPTSEFQQYRTLCRLRVTGLANTQFSSVITPEAFHTIQVRRLPTTGSTGLDSGSNSLPSNLSSAIRTLANHGHKFTNLAAVKRRPDACRLEREKRLGEMAAARLAEKQQGIRHELTGCNDKIYR
jgi:hypothetical protein